MITDPSPLLGKTKQQDFLEKLHLLVVFNLSYKY